MRIYSINRTAAGPLTPDAQTLQKKQEVSATIQRLEQSIAVINKGVKTIEQTGLINIFTKNGIIGAIQGGDLSKFDINTVNQGLQAMRGISTTMPIINNCLRYLQENTDIAAQVNPNFANINNIYTMMVTQINTGDYSQFQSGMANYEAQMPGMAGTANV